MINKDPKFLVYIMSLRRLMFAFAIGCRSCPKAYHLSCIGRDAAFFKKKGAWLCGMRSRIS